MERTKWMLAAAACLLPAAKAHAAVSPDQLEALVKAQSEEIARLRARLDAVEQKQGTVATAPASQPAAAADAPAPGATAKPAQVAAATAKAPDIKVNWKQGSPEFSNASGTISFRPRVRLSLDAASVSGSRFSDRNLTGTEARYLRLGAEGRVGKAFNYLFEVDFPDSGMAVRSAFINYSTKIGKVGTELSFGNRLTERGFDASTNSANTPFLERSLVASGIRPQRGYFGMGLTAKAFGKNWHAAFQVTGDDVNNSGTANDSLTFSGRAHWNPVLNDNMMVHVGLSGFYEKLPGDVVATPISAWVGSHFDDYTHIESGPMPGISSSYALFGEAAFIWGPFWTYGEYGHRRFTSRLATVGHFDHEAYAVQAGYFLTGEHPGYLGRTGQWGKPVVLHPVGEGGMGAFELAARYEALDMSDQPTGGKGWAATAGVNWGMTDIVRLMIDFSRWHIDNRTGKFIGSDDGNTVATRLQVAF